MTMPPKAFISHASEDKERFVVEFAESLRSHGVEAWLDKWELRAGDSLVDRIFEEGIKEASAFIIILSSISVAKPWVKEELNAGFVRRIAGKCRIIPILIDECEVPECLKSTLWERVCPQDCIKDVAAKIANQIHGISDKPQIGRPPLYVETTADIFPDLTRQDQIVLKIACEISMVSGWGTLGSTSICEKLKEQGLTDEEITDSLTVLQGRGLIDVRWTMGGGFVTLQIAEVAFEHFLRVTESQYPSMVDEICLQIVNHRLMNNVQIQKATGYVPRIVNHTLQFLSSRRLIRVIEAMGGAIGILDVSPELKRHFSDRI